MSHTWKRSARLLLLGLLLTAPAAAQLPSANALREQYIRAIGGADALRKHNSVHLTGQFEVPAQGITGSIEAWNSDGRLLSVVEIPGIGSIRTGFDGTTGWQIHPAMGAQVLTGRRLDQTRQEADMLSELTPDKYIKSSETVEKTTFDGKDAYKVKVVLHNGEEYFQFYDATTSLNIGSIRQMESPMGAIEATTTILEYKKFGDLLMAARMKQGAMGMDQLISITNVEFTSVPRETFELPKEIKALSGK